MEIFEVRRTVARMMKDRGYAMDSYEQWLLSPDANLETFISHRAGVSRDKAYDTPDGINRTFVHYEESTDSIAKDKRKAVDDIRRQQDNIWKAHRQTGVAIDFFFVIVSKAPLAATAKKDFIKLSMRDGKYIQQLFTFDELRSPIIDHIMVPPHLILDTEEKKLRHMGGSLGARHSIIRGSDPVAKYYMAQPGDIFQVTFTDTSNVVDKYFSYKVVRAN